MERVIAQQLQLMSQQLELLRGAGAAPPASSVEAPVTPAAPVRPALTPVPATEDAASAPSGANRPPAPKAHGAWKPIDKRKRGPLTPRQQEHLDALIERYTRRTRGSKRLTEEQRARLSDPRAVSGFNQQWKEMIYQIAIATSSGGRVVDVDGNEYVDVTMGFGVNLLGHSPDFVVQAIGSQLRQGLEIGVLSPLAGRVADQICRMTGMERVSFLNTGSEANMAALRAARTVTGRERIAVFAGSYHGIFDEVLVQRVPARSGQRSMPIAPGIPPRMVEDVLVLDYGDPRSLDDLDAQGDQLAAVFVEAVQSRHPDLQPREFLHQLREVTRRRGIALILDEVVTGFRLHPRGAQGFYGIDADIASYGKLIGGGMPIAVVAGKAAYLDAFDGGAWRYGDDSFPESGVTFFGGTFVKHPLALAATAAVLDHLEAAGPGLQAELNARSSRLIGRLNDFFVREQVAIWIEHCGSMLCFTFPDDNELARLLFYYLRAKGLHVWDRPAFLATVHTDEDLQFIERVVTDSVLEMREAGLLPEPSGRAASAGHRVAATLLAEPSGNGTQVATPAAPAVAETGPVPPTESQMEIWHASLLGDEASCAFILSYSVDLRGRLDEVALRTALQQVVDRHDSLRATFSPAGDRLRFAALRLEVPLLDWTALEPAEREARVKELVAAEVERPFDLVNGPLVRAQLLRLEPEHHRLVFSVHHSICDGYSSGVVMRDLAKLYSAVCRGGDPDLPAPMAFSEYARWQHGELSGPDHDAAEAFWLAHCQDVPPLLELPTDRPRPAVKTFNNAEQLWTIDRELCNRVRQIGARRGGTLFSTLLAAYVTLLHRLTGQEDIVVSVPASGQSIVGREDLVGHCVNLHPLRLRVNSEQPFAELLAHVQGRVLDAYEHRNYTFGSLLKKLRLPRDPSRLPLFATQFNLEPEKTGLDFLGLDVDVSFNRRRYYSLDFGFNVVEAGGGLSLRCEFNRDLFDEETARRWLGHFQAVLDAIAADPGQRVGDLALLTERERQSLLGTWRGAATETGRDRCVQTLVEAQTARTPTAVAVEHEGRQLTYAELDQRADEVARRLRALAVGPGDLVGLFVERSLDMVAGLVGILKSGAAYVPLDPAYPAERLAFIVEDAGVGVILTQERLVERVPSPGVRVLCLDGPRAPTPDGAGGPGRAPGPEDLAYVIYTSGSAGRPKGVEIRHRNVVSFLRSMQHVLGLGPSDRLLAVTTLSFDIAVLELILPLTVGARVVVASREAAMDGRDLAALLGAVGATVMQATPTTWRMLVDADWTGSQAFTALCGGETLPPELAGQLRPRCRTLWNLYGPTETTIWSCCHRVESSNGRVPIGRALANTEIYVLDGRQQLAPVGASGELFIGGAGVARGYLRRADLTAERFIADPWRDDPAARLYRTGDIARFRADGVLEFLGRADHQVKLRGFRIELGEIEAVLSRHPGVREAVVVLREDGPRDRRLVAYLVVIGDARQVTGDVRALARESLPDYMVPSAFVVLPSLPLTANGKVDRRALPAADEHRPDLASAFLPPRTETEATLARFWSEVLRVEKVGVHDNFFDLGGHSLAATEIVARIRAAYGVDLTLRTLFEAPTVAGLAGPLEARLVKVNEGAPGAGQRDEIVL